VKLWVYENWRVHGHRATVHRGECGSCNHGSGIHAGSSSRNGRWLGPFNTPDATKDAVPSSVIEVELATAVRSGEAAVRRRLSASIQVDRDYG
jgi:hypothetical protein